MKSKAAFCFGYKPANIAFGLFLLSGLHGRTFLHPKKPQEYSSFIIHVNPFEKHKFDYGLITGPRTDPVHKVIRGDFIRLLSNYIN